MDKSYVYCANSYIGQLINDNGKYSFIIEHDDDYYSDRGIRRYALDRRGNDSDFLYNSMVCGRIRPSNRYNIREILDSHGLNSYDPWKLLKCAHGRNVNDLIWMHTEKVDPSWFFDHPDGFNFWKGFDKAWLEKKNKEVYEMKHKK